MRVYLFRYLGLIKDVTILSKLFFYTNITCRDGSVVPGGKWPITWSSHQRHVLVSGILLFPVSLGLSNIQFSISWEVVLKDPIKPQAKSKDVSPLWGVYIENPLPTEWNLGGIVTGIGDRMGGPYAFDFLTPYTTINPATSS